MTWATCSACSAAFGWIQPAIDLQDEGDITGTIMKDLTCRSRLHWLNLLLPLLLMASFISCVRVKTEPIRIEPIYIEITINHRVQKELDDFFADIDKASETAAYAPVEDGKPQP